MSSAENFTKHAAVNNAIQLPLILVTRAKSADDKLIFFFSFPEINADIS